MDADLIRELPSMPLQSLTYPHGPYSWSGELGIPNEVWCTKAYRSR